MASLWYLLAARDNSNGGARVTGLAPSWVILKRVDDNSAVATLPPITEIGQGLYKFAFDAELYGDCAGQVDLWGGITSSGILDSDRYVDIFLTRESSRLLSAVNSAGQVVLAPGGLDAVPVEVGVNARQALAPILAASAGVLLGAGTGTVVIKGGNVTTTRITASMDNAGNRTAVTLSLPA